MTRQDVETLFNRRQEAWNSRDPVALTELHTEEGTIVSPIFRTVHGRREILESYRSLFTHFPDWTLTGQALLIDGTRIAQSFRVEATHAGDFMGMPGSGRRFDIEGMLLFEMQDGLVAYERRYYDFTGLLIQLGVLRSKPGRG
jgi:steroid delta-isomerase-like uncharacterized protein